MSDNWKVYIHINKINHKSYVGITSQSLQRRWGKNGCNYSKKQVFYKAIKKYGWDNFEHILLEDKLSCEEAGDKEKLYIQKYNSLVPNGYNSAEGGYNYNISKFQKENMSKLKSKAVICIDTNEVFESAVKAGEKYHVSSKAILLATKDRYRVCCDKHWMNYEEYLKIGFVPQNRPNQRKVICLETQQVFNSISEAESYFNIYRGGILRCCNKKTESCKGQHWAFYEEYINNNGQIKTKTRKSKGYKVKCIETGEIFASMNEAGNKYGVTSATIKPACENKNRTAAGKHWQYI